MDAVGRLEGSWRAAVASPGTSMRALHMHLRRTCVESHAQDLSEASGPQPGARICLPPTKKGGKPFSHAECFSGAAFLTLRVSDVVLHTARP